jgi:hypothetical protein
MPPFLFRQLTPGSNTDSTDNAIGRNMFPCPQMLVGTWTQTQKQYTLTSTPRQMRIWGGCNAAVRGM